MVTFSVHAHNNGVRTTRLHVHERFQPSYFVSAAYCMLGECLGNRGQATDICSLNSRNSARHWLGTLTTVHSR